MKNKELATVIKCSSWKELHENLMKAEEAGVPVDNIFFDPSPLEPFIPGCHITVNGVPECQAPIYQMHKAAGNSSTVMCDSAVACGHGENREEAEADAAKLRLAFPDANIQVVDGTCHSDPWWKTPEGQSALEAENSIWDDQLPKLKEEKLFIHDCSKCVFLGRITINGKSGDVYVCSKEDRANDNVIVRFSSEGSNYSCTHPSTFSPLDAFAAAAVAMWSEHHGYNGWNSDGTLFKDGKPEVRLWPKQEEFRYTANPK